QIRTSLLGAYSNCDLLIKDCTISSAKLDGILEDAECAVLHLRKLTETIRPRQAELSHKQNTPAPLALAGTIEVNEFGWLHITLNTLLPNCRFKTPAYLQNTLSALLTHYPKDGRQLPHFDHAMLIIEEHCDIQNRQVFDQDNKSWKAIPNAIKGLIVPDDDQFTLEVALLSKLDSKASCHIYVLPADDAGEYFSIRSGNFGYSL
ncbi:MAG: hypothetical protein RR049_06060, partial [Angelakisella sp.]